MKTLSGRQRTRRRTSDTYWETSVGHPLEIARAPLSRYWLSRDSLVAGDYDAPFPPNVFWRRNNHQRGRIITRRSNGVRKIIFVGDRAGKQFVDGAGANEDLVFRPKFSEELFLEANRLNAGQHLAIAIQQKRPEMGVVGRAGEVLNVAPTAGYPSMVDLNLLHQRQRPPQHDARQIVDRGATQNVIGRLLSRAIIHFGQTIPFRWTSALNASACSR